MTSSDSPEGAIEEAKDAVAETVETAEKAASDFSNDFTAAIPEGFRDMAEKAIAQSRENYEKAKDAMEDTVQAFEKSFDAYGQGASAFSQKLFEMAQTNMNTSFAFAKQLSEAKDFGEFAKMQQAFMQKQMETFSDQAGEIRTLSAKIAEDASAPIKSQFDRALAK
ncbi:phasin family protein [Methyloligella sp. 2.7D]|uniref:phasin family protein n=1 Tax=unclassified Methyloligella TaxID=2625955 RepID=UPI00157DD62A|nr:phasin family protein [Methyloligella sp. GL2]QKP78381.1 phasin family protein [Methyloligella sp. GL2]